MQRGQANSPRMLVVLVVVVTLTGTRYRVLPVPEPELDRVTRGAATRTGVVRFDELVV